MKKNNNIIPHSENLLKSSFKQTEKARQKLEAENGFSFKIENVSKSEIENEKIKFCNEYGFPIRKLYLGNGEELIKSYVIFDYDKEKKILSCKW